MYGTFSDNDTAINPPQKASEGDFSFCKYRADNIDYQSFYYLTNIYYN